LLFVGVYCDDLVVAGACEQLMTSTSDGSCVCACSDGFSLNADGRTCTSGQLSQYQSVTVHIILIFLFKQESRAITGKPHDVVGNFDVYISLPLDNSYAERHFFHTSLLFRLKFRGVPFGVDSWCWSLQTAKTVD